MERKSRNIHCARLLALVAAGLVAWMSRSTAIADVVVREGSLVPGHRLEIADESAPQSEWMREIQSAVANEATIAGSEALIATSPWYKRPGTVTVTESPVASFLAFVMFAAGVCYALNQRQRKTLA